MAVEVREVPDVVAWVVPIRMRAAGFLLVCRRCCCRRCVQLLRAAGHTSAVNLYGGLEAWAREVDPAFPLY